MQCKEGLMGDFKTEHRLFVCSSILGLIHFPPTPPFFSQLHVFFPEHLEKLWVLQITWALELDQTYFGQTTKPAKSPFLIVLVASPLLVSTSRLLVNRVLNESGPSSCPTCRSFV